MSTSDPSSESWPAPPLLLPEGWTWLHDDEGWSARSDDTIITPSNDNFGTLRFGPCDQECCFAPISVCIAVALANGIPFGVRPRKS